MKAIYEVYLNSWSFLFKKINNYTIFFYKIKIIDINVWIWLNYNLGFMIGKSGKEENIPLKKKNTIFLKLY